MSIEEFESTTPVKPPHVNKKIKPSTHKTGALDVRYEPYSVLTHLNTLIPVGMAIIMVAAVKYARVSKSIPTVNMWCAHTIKPKRPIVLIAYTIPKWPKVICLPLK